MLIITRPAGLAVALVVAWVAAASIRAATQRAATGRVALTQAAMVRSVIYSAAAAIIAVLLTLIGGPVAHGLLALAAAGAGIWLTVELYRRERVGRARRAVLVMLRSAAWLLLLALVGGLAWERVIMTWEKPILVVLLDHSRSMAIVDPPADDQPERSRAALVQAAVDDSETLIERLGELNDVRLYGFGTQLEPVERWGSVPVAPVTRLADALQTAGELRTGRGRPAAAIVVISDGAENVADATALRQVAADLADQRTAIYGVGVGPEPGRTPLVELDPLVLPPRIGVRDHLEMTVRGRVQGCVGHTLPVDVFWDDQPAAADEATIGYAIQHLDVAFDLLPPGPGVHRVAARVRLPDSLGGHQFFTSGVVDVVADEIRVAYVERVPSNESKFIVRAWDEDERFAVARVYLSGIEAGAGGAQRILESLAGQDVIVLGRVGSQLAHAVLQSLADAVVEHGAGLLISGGRGVLSNRNYVDSPLATVSPVQLVDSQSGLTGQLRFVPTDAGLRHPVLEHASRAQASKQPETAMNERAAWLALPPFGSAAQLGPPKPVAEVLGADGAGRPLLVAQEVGRGRCLAAAWESTWPWVLASDDGRQMHDRLWRQAVIWLANRRPRAWVSVDRPQYVLAALAGGQQQIHIHAGISGLDDQTAATGLDGLRVSLRLKQVGAPQPTSAPQPLSVEHTERGWTAMLPSPRGESTALAAGGYELEFFVRTERQDADAAASPPGGPVSEYTARTRFDVVAEDIELRLPTANLALLRSTAEQTASCGGRYGDLTHLSAILSEFTAHDQRQRIMTPIRYDLIERDPWGLLAWLLILLGCEWAIRKRGGLS